MLHRPRFTGQTCLMPVGGIGTAKVISSPPQEATSLGAVFQFFLRDMMGMVGGVVFASVQGSSFDAYAKQWRLFADCLNNVGVPAAAAD